MTTPHLTLEMERRVYEAAVEGNVISLLNLLQQDALVLDRVMVRCYAETPLHIASMLGHVEFVKEILSRKAELARVLDSRMQSSPLHMATAKGYLDIVKELLSVAPEMCFVEDRDGINPLHIAAIKGHITILKELVQVRPNAARMLTAKGETILHLCVRYNQLEAMKLLLPETITSDDHEFVNVKDRKGNTILHLAVADKQVEAIKYMTTTSTRIEVNAVNANGFTAMDVLTQSIRERDVKDWEMGELLRQAGAICATKDIHSSQEANIDQVRYSSYKSSGNNDKNQEGWSEKTSNTLMVVASLMAAMAFQAAVTPPGGSWQEDYFPNSNVNAAPPAAESPFNSIMHLAGESIMANRDPSSYQRFLICNTTGFVASLSIILLLISGLPIRRKFFMWILTVIMWVAVSSMALTYLFSITCMTSKEFVFSTASAVLLIWLGLLAVLLLSHIIRLLVKLVKYFVRLSRSRRKSPLNYMVMN